MKKTTFLKTLLVAVGLCVGSSSAWADEVNATLVHTASSSVAGTKGVFTSTVDAENEHVNNASLDGTWGAVAYAEFSFDIPAGHAITAATFTFTGLGESRNTRNCDVYYVTAGSSLDYTELAGGSAKVNLGGTKITSVTFPKGETATQEFNIDAADALKAMVSAGQSSIIFKLTGNPGGGDLKGKGSSVPPTLVITTADASSTTSYTVRFVDESDNEIKDAAVYTDVTIGSEQTASASDMASFTVGDKKYIYNSGNTTITTVAAAASNVITLVFREAAKVNYALIDNTTSTQVTSGTGFEADVINAYYPHYVLKDGKLYDCPKQGSNPWYGLSITLGTSDAEETLNYSATEIQNVVFYSEGESIEGASANKGGNYSDIRSFGGAVGYASSDLTITTLAPGKYIIKADLFTPTSAMGSQTFTVGEEVFTLKSTSNGYHNELTTEEFEVTTPTDVIWVAGGGATSAVDWLYIQKIITEVIPSSNATGFLTFAADVALDFSATETKAYIATEVADSKVKLTQVSKVPAGTGLILERADGSTEAIPVLSGDADDVSANKLVRGTGAAVDAGYVLVNRDGTAEFAGIGTDKPVVAKDQAYLNIAAEAPYLQFVFAESETTGISTVKATATNGAIYNLNGQRVAKATKGLYIVNGKKAIIK